MALDHKHERAWANARQMTAETLDQRLANGAIRIRLAAMRERLVSNRNRQPLPHGR
jgi:hypothetical protein